jgi:hypothetical protein
MNNKNKNGNDVIEVTNELNGEKGSTCPECGNKTLFTTDSGSKICSIGTCGYYAPAADLMSLSLGPDFL